MLSLISERLVMESSVFCDVTRRRLVVCYRRFGTLLKDWIDTLFRTKAAYLETWMTNYQVTARNILEERISHLHSGESLNSLSVI